MGKAGRALKQVLKAYGITQNQLSLTIGTDRSNVNRWVAETRDPSGEAIAAIKAALAKLELEAADEFVRLFLYSNLGKVEE